jgi:hypothetical protein
MKIQELAREWNRFCDSRTTVLRNIVAYLSVRAKKDYDQNESADRTQLFARGVSDVS